MLLATTLMGFLLYGALVYATGQTALRKGRSHRGWMWAMALLCPFPLALLALLPDKQGPQTVGRDAATT